MRGARSAPSERGCGVPPLGECAEKVVSGESVPSNSNPTFRTSFSLPRDATATRRPALHFQFPNSFFICSERSNFLELQVLPETLLWVRINGLPVRSASYPALHLPVFSSIRRIDQGRQRGSGRLSVVGCRLSVVGCRLSVVGRAASDSAISNRRFSQTGSSQVSSLRFPL
jgi:hypothetical protein